MNALLTVLIEHLGRCSLAEASVIPWGSPVPSFGNISQSRIATLGLNPSNREFVDVDGTELDGRRRRFHTLSSLNLSRWSDARTHHLQLILDSCHEYFSRNPYDAWFRALDLLISETDASYYESSSAACHLDLIPYATSRKWAELTNRQRSLLLNATDSTLGLLLRDSPVRLLILNGKTVVENFERISGVHLEKLQMLDWTLPRKSSGGIRGFAYRGVVESIADIGLRHKVVVLGFNHNIQSSYGVTKRIKESIRNWIGGIAQEMTW